jgi:hypothetical protein
MAESNTKDKFAFQQDSMKFISGSPLVQAAMAPHTGRYIKLHELLGRATPQNIRTILTLAWDYADQSDPTELAFIIALSQMFFDAYPGETFHPKATVG